MNNSKLDSMQAELREKQIQNIKAAVRLTLEKMEELERQKGILQDQIKILKHDLFDLKDGRLDRIVERQTLQTESTAISRIKVVKQENVPGTSPWYEHYELCVQDGDGILSCKVNNSLIRMHASGTYRLTTGEVKYV